jgi:hypothetical protein
MEAGKSRLKGDSLRDATNSEVKDLRAENARLKEEEAMRVLTIARLHPELSSRPLAVKITEEEDLGL